MMGMHVSGLKLSLLLASLLLSSCLLNSDPTLIIDKTSKKASQSLTNQSLNRSYALWVPSIATQTIQGFSVDAKDKTLSSAWVISHTVGDPTAVITHPNGRFVYVFGGGNATNGFTATIQEYSINPQSGTLLTIRQPYYPGGADISFQVGAISPDGKFLYTHYSNSNQMPNAVVISSHKIDPITGGLSPTGFTHTISPASGASMISSQQMLITPSSQTAYLTVNTSYPASPGVGQIYPLTLDPVTGEITSTHLPGTVPYSAIGLAMDTQALAIYCLSVETSSGTLTTFRLQANGSLVLPAQSTLVIPGGGGSFPSLHPSEKFLFIPDGGKQTVSVFTLDPITRTPTLLGSSNRLPAVQGISSFVFSTVLDSEGNTVYVSTMGYAQFNKVSAIIAYQFDETTGTLTPKGTYQQISYFAMRPSLISWR